MLLLTVSINYCESDYLLILWLVAFYSFTKICSQEVQSRQTNQDSIQSLRSINQECIA
jgi:hypothetical protein